jgi:hypothetical protein
MTDQEKILLMHDALCTILHRISGTIAEDWVAPNPTASEQHAMAQYSGELAEFIFEVLERVQPGDSSPSPA